MKKNKQKEIVIPFEDLPPEVVEQLNKYLSSEDGDEFISWELDEFDDENVVGYIETIECNSENESIKEKVDFRNIIIEGMNITRSSPSIKTIFDPPEITYKDIIDKLGKDE